jgi:hypothetical protein
VAGRSAICEGLDDFTTELNHQPSGLVRHTTWPCRLIIVQIQDELLDSAHWAGRGGVFEKAWTTSPGAHPPAQRAPPAYNMLIPAEYRKDPGYNLSLKHETFGPATEMQGSGDYGARGWAWPPEEIDTGSPPNSRHPTSRRTSVGSGVGTASTKGVSHQESTGGGVGSVDESWTLDPQQLLMRPVLMKTGVCRSCKPQGRRWKGAAGRTGLFDRGRTSESAACYRGPPSAEAHRHGVVPHGLDRP